MSKFENSHIQNKPTTTRNKALNISKKLNLILNSELKLNY